MTARRIAGKSPRDKVTAAEWATRLNLAACYRLAGHFRRTDGILTHISARAPDSDGHFLINAYGPLFDEITASILAKGSLEGEVFEDALGRGIYPSRCLICRS